ncbi:MAG: HEAT repeat domain-containing protein [Limisphaerales bacterium]
MRVAPLFLVGLALAVSATTSAAPADPLDRLDQALKAVPAFEYGKDAGPLGVVEQVVVQAAKDPALRLEVEARLLELLRNPATRDAKEFLCRQLFTIGTARSAPSLEHLLTDPGLSHIARFALGRNEDPAAGDALYRALGKTSGKLQAGIINSLGDRRYEKAVPDLQGLLEAPEPLAAEAAATALGKIGGPNAVTALEAARGKATSNLARRLDEALLLAAGRFLADGQKEAATRIYESFYAPSEPRNLRIAGLRGLLAAGGSQAVPALVESIRSADPPLRSAAIGLSGTVGGEATTRALADLLPALPPEAQELLLGALAARNDPAALSAVQALAVNSSGPVRAAAYEALGAVGEASVVGMLVGAAAAGAGPEQQAARGSLLQISRGDVTRALVQQALLSAEPNRQIEAIRAIAGRRATGAVGELLRLASGAAGPVCREAIKALGVLVDQTTLGCLVGLTLNLREAEDLMEVEQAAAAAFQRVADPERQAAPVLALCRTAPAGAQPVLLRLLSRTGTPGALAAVRAALGEQNAMVREGALRALADWPDAAPAEDLLAQVRAAGDATSKVVALRGFVRMAGLSKDPAAMYARAMELAERPEDKKLVLGSLGAAEPLAAMKLVEPCLKNDQLRAEAALAAIQIADRLRQQDAVRAKAIAKEALAVASDAALRQKGQEVINQIEQFEGYILDWVACGPYQEKDKDAHALFDLVLPPEGPDAANVKWTRLAKGLGTWDVNLAEALGGGDDVVAYARTRVWSPRQQPAQFEFGSDDGIKAWLNDTVIHANNVERGIAPRQDIAKANLKEGWNVLVLKITNRSGGWGFCCRIRQPEGAALEGLKTEAQ